MKKISMLFIFLCLIPHAYAAPVHNITIGTDTLYCGDVDFICPSDYAGCGNCVNDFGDVNDIDCCNSACPNVWCTIELVVCGDSANELAKDETDSAGSIEGSGSEEDCYTDATPCTSEHVIDDSNEQACVDTYYNGTAVGYDYTYNCADDGILFKPYTATGNVCEEDVSCRNTDVETTEDNGDMEICDTGNWHDADESEDYCIATGKIWIAAGTITGIDEFLDDYNGILDDGYCEDDDGYIITGAVLGETYRSSSYCEALTDVTITIKDTATAAVITTDTTELYSSWEYETLTCHESSYDNSVGTYSVTLEPGTYYLVAEKAGYNTVTRTITIDAADQTLTSFWMYMNAECQSDCTMNDRVCHAECADVNGCTYQMYGTESIATYCDGLRNEYRVVLSETETDDSVSGYEVYCCTGTPQSYSREYFTADDVETSCVENVIEQSKAVTVNGEILNIHFVLFSDPKPEKTGCSQYEDYACEIYGDAFC